MNDFVTQLKTKQSIVAASEWLPPPAVVYAYALQTFLTSLILATDIQGLVSNYFLHERFCYPTKNETINCGCK